MANIKSAKKRVKTNELSRKRNVARRSDIKSATKKLLDALATKDVKNAKTFLQEVESKIARAQGKGLFKANTAARKISRIDKRVAQAAK